MAENGVKFVPTIHALLYAADLLFSCLSYDVILEDLMYHPCVRLEVGATSWRAVGSLSYEVALDVCSTVRSCLRPHYV